MESECKQEHRVVSTELKHQENGWMSCEADRDVVGDEEESKSESVDTLWDYIEVKWQCGKKQAPATKDHHESLWDLFEAQVYSTGSTDPAVIAMTSETERKRQNHIHELISTEESYRKDLNVMLEVFGKTLQPVLTQNEYQQVFVNWKELIMCNTKLVKSLRVRRKMTGEGQVIPMIGDILCENLPHMTPYVRYCSCQLNASALIQKKFEEDARFKEASKKCAADPRTMGMPISSYMLKPLQRVTKYPLLIEKILKYTPEDHPDHQNLQEAMTKANELCNQVNEGVRERENSDKLEWIQAHTVCEGLSEKITFNSVTNCLGPRKFLHSGTLYKAKSGKELVGLLFSDFLLLAQPQRSLGAAASVFSFDVKANTMFKMYKNPIFLNEVMIKKLGENETDSQVFHLHHMDSRGVQSHVYSLKAVSNTERDAWVKKIEAASKYYLETERKKREKAHSARLELRFSSVGRLLVVLHEGINLVPGNEVRASSIKDACGRLLVIVHEGVDLIACDDNGKSDPYCEVSMGAQEHKTKVINNTLNPKWNANMQFTIKDLQEDVLCITVYDRDLFSPNDFLGRTEVRINDILNETKATKGPITKHLPLHEVESGQVVVKLDLQLFETH